MKQNADLCKKLSSAELLAETGTEAMLLHASGVAQGGPRPFLSTCALGTGYKLNAIERKINATTKTAVNARSIDKPPARIGGNARRTGAITGSVPA